MVVECVEEEETESHIRRVFNVIVGEEQRQIQQFQYTRWVCVTTGKMHC